MAAKDDISVMIEGVRLNFRVAGLIKYKNKVLLQRGKNEDFWSFLGGRVKIGESSQTALKRELMEEIKLEFDNVKLIHIAENFFEYDNQNYHELLYVYLIELNKLYEGIDKDTFDSLDNKTLLYKWFDLSEVKNINCLPKIIYDLVERDNFDKIVHSVIDEKSRL